MPNPPYLWFDTKWITWQNIVQNRWHGSNENSKAQDQYKFWRQKIGSKRRFFKPCLLFEFTSKLNFLITTMARTYLPLLAAAVSQPVRTAVKLLIVHKMVWQPANHTARRPSQFNDIFLLSTTVSPPWYNFYLKCAH